MAKAIANSGAVFERHEKKFILTEKSYEALTRILKAQMNGDDYGKHTICTIYYDTQDYALIRHSMEHPAFKEKLRLRSYGVPATDDTVYLELKKKLAGVTYKRRVPISLYEAEQYLAWGVTPSTKGKPQIFSEIDWFVQQTPLRPKVLLAYDRIALSGKTDSELRITFDRDIRWRDENLSLGKGDYGALLLPHELCLMELKTIGAMPMWLCEALSELKIYPSSYSKYGTVYREHLQYARKEGLRHAG